MNGKYLPLAATVIVVALGSRFSTPARGEDADVAILIEYVQVPPPSENWFEKTTLTSMHEHHATLVDEGKIFAWYTYRVRFPLGERAAYNHVVVTVFRDRAAMVNRDRDIPYGDYITAREVFVPFIESEGYATMRSPYASVSFLRVTEDGNEAFRESFERHLRPRFDELIGSAQWKTWGLFAKKNPNSSDSYHYALVARHESFAGAETPIPQTPATTNPTLVKSELWKTLDSVLVTPEEELR